MESTVKSGKVVEMLHPLTRIKSLLDRLIPPYARVPVLLCLVANQVSYNGARLINRLRGATLHNIETAMDAWFPFSPAWVLIYIGCFLWWVIATVYVCRSSRKNCREYLLANVVGKAICLVVFVLYPTTNVRPDVSGGGFLCFLMRVVYAVDTPDNLFPSMHCQTSWLLFRYMKGSGAPRWLRVFSLAEAIAIFLSTLYTRQHVFVDVPAGVLVAELSILAVRLFSRNTP